MRLARKMLGGCHELDHLDGVLFPQRTTNEFIVPQASMDAKEQASLAAKEQKRSARPTSQ